MSPLPSSVYMEKVPRWLTQFNLLIVACCQVPDLSFQHNNDKMAEVNLLMTTLLNFVRPNNLLFLQG